MLAVFKTALQPLAFLAGLVSVCSFLGIAWRVGQHNALLARVVAVDLVALVCLLAGAIACALQRAPQASA